MTEIPSPLPFDIEGGDGFKMRIQSCLAVLGMTRSGKEILRGIHNSGHRVSILPTAQSNGYCEAADVERACSPGEGCGSTIAWNPDLEHTSPTDHPGAIVILAKLLIHAYYNARGMQARSPSFVYPGQYGKTCPEEERLAIGLGGSFINGPEGGLVHVANHGSAFPSENSFREEMRIARRSTFYPKNWPGGSPW